MTAMRLVLPTAPRDPAIDRERRQGWDLSERHVVPASREQQPRAIPSTEESGDGKAMSSEQLQYRLAVTVFDDPANLSRAVFSLLADGLQSAQLCLVAYDETLTYLKENKNLSDDIRGRLAFLWTDVSDWPGYDGAARVVATSGPLLTRLGEIDTALDDVRRPFKSIASQRSLLVEQIDPGTLALVVSSADAAQQRQSTRRLLQATCHSVKTFEFPLSPRTAQSDPSN